ncbi:MAG: Lrp/AsnC family transcriptional regulator [Chitinophagaceae bacterium]
MEQHIDELDKQILQFLQQDATVTIKEMAIKLKKSVATIHDRVVRLRSNGVVLRTVALLDRKKIGKELLAFTHVLLKEHTIETLAAFEQKVSAFPEVLECFQMTGSFDFLLRIVTGSMEEYHDFYRYKMATLPGIVTVQSFFVLSESKSVTVFPL